MTVNAKPCVILSKRKNLLITHYELRIINATILTRKTKIYFAGLISPAFLFPKNIGVGFRENLVKRRVRGHKTPRPHTVTNANI